MCKVQRTLGWHHRSSMEACCVCFSVVCVHLKTWSPFTLVVLVLAATLFTPQTPKVFHGLKHFTLHLHRADWIMDFHLWVNYPFKPPWLQTCALTQRHHSGEVHQQRQQRVEDCDEPSLSKRKSLPASSKVGGNFPSHLFSANERADRAGEWWEQRWWSSISGDVSPAAGEWTRGLTHVCWHGFNLFEEFSFWFVCFSVLCLCVVSLCCVSVLCLCVVSLCCASWLTTQPVPRAEPVQRSRDGVASADQCQLCTRVQRGPALDPGFNLINTLCFLLFNTVWDVCVCLFVCLCFSLMNPVQTTRGIKCLTLLWTN